MPFIVIRDEAACSVSSPWAVYTEAGGHGTGRKKGSPHGCHTSKTAAMAQLRALYANVPEAKSEAPSPPNLRDSEDAEECCGTCHMFSNGKCWGYGNYEVKSNQVCDSYAPEPAADEAKSAGTEVPMSATISPALTPRTIEWRRTRALALSESQRKHTETRQVHEPLELREANSDGIRILRSYASLFNEPYTIRAGGYRFQEIVRPGAFKRTIGTNPDVVFRYDHSGPPLARTTSGTLRLGEDDKGLWYEADLNPEDPDVKALIPKIERGDLSESSFAFRLGHNGDKWNDEHDERELLACELDRGDVSVVTFGASRATGKHMLIRSEEALIALQDIGFERFVEAWIEWRDWSVLSTEERLGKIISSQSMETLRQVLGLIADADDAVDEAEAMLSDFLGVPNPDEDTDEKGEADESDEESVTSSEQLGKLGRSEERDEPTYEDYDVMYGLKNAKLALASVKACQLCDPDYETDPDDKAVMTQIEAAEAAIDQALIAQAKDGRRDPESERAQVVEYWQTIERLASEVDLDVRWLTQDNGSWGFEILSSEDAYWLRSQDDIPEELRVDLSTAGREAMAKEGTAMQDGSYPIPNVEFLKKAIRAFGRAKNKTAVKAWIKRRAKALGASNLIPESWRTQEQSVALLANDSEDLLDVLRERSLRNAS